jgi:hypothetical protein
MNQKNKSGLSKPVSSKPASSKPGTKAKHLDTLNSVKRFTEFPSFPPPTITYHKKSIEKIFKDEELLYQWVIQNKTITYVYIDQAPKEPEDLLCTKVITVSRKALINMCHLLFFIKRYVIRYLDALFQDRESITLYIYICGKPGAPTSNSGSGSNRYKYHTESMMETIIPKEIMMQKNGQGQGEGHWKGRRSRRDRDRGFRGGYHRANHVSTSNQLIAKINAKSTRSGLLYQSVNNHNHIIESLMSEATLRFYERSLYCERAQLLYLHNTVQALTRFLRSIYRFFDHYFIRKFFLTSGSILMLNGLRQTNDIDFRMTIYNLSDMQRLKEKMETLIRPMELDISYVTDDKEYIVQDPSKHFFFMGIKCQLVEDELVSVYQHEVRDDRIKSKADVLMASYLLNENVPIYFSKEDIPVSKKKKMIQIFKYYYKMSVTVDEIDQMIDQHPRLNRGTGNRNGNGNRNKSSSSSSSSSRSKSKRSILGNNILKKINELRNQVMVEKKRAEEYVQIRIPW